MESGHDIYYPGNTVGLNPDYHEIWQEIHAIKPGEITFDTSKQNPEYKVFATSRCDWCSFPFSGRWLIICPLCGNCQYCGTHSPTGHNCRWCGNEWADELKTEVSLQQPIGQPDLNPSDTPLQL
jgi:hypothetical protein